MTRQKFTLQGAEDNSAETQKAIDEINALVETVEGLEVVFIGGNGAVIPNKGF